MYQLGTAIASLKLLNTDIPDNTTKVILFIAIVLIGITSSRYITRLVRLALGNSSMGEISIVVNIIRAAFVILIIYFVGENVFHLHLGVLVQALGVTTLLVTLGLQDFIKNIIAGIQIVVTRLFKVTDHLDVGDLRGEVMDINWRQTTLRDKDGNPHVVPNATLMGEKFMRRDGKMAQRYIIDCDIKPGIDLDMVAADIQQLADKVLDENGWRTGEPTEVRFLGSTANGVQASIRIYLKDIELTTRGMDAVMRAIGKRGYLADWTNDNPAQEQWR